MLKKIYIGTIKKVYLNFLGKYNRVKHDDDIMNKECPICLEKFSKNDGVESLIVDVLSIRNV